MNWGWILLGLLAIDAVLLSLAGWVHRNDNKAYDPFHSEGD